jgi:hypothetical protein
MSNFKTDNDPNNITDMTESDTNHDGLSDGQEDFDKNGSLELNEPNPLDRDSDDDGVYDGEDGLGDADGDGVKNCVEVDCDNDGVNDGTELGRVGILSVTSNKIC